MRYVLHTKTEAQPVRTLTHSYTVMPISMDGASFLNYVFVFMGHEVHCDFVP
jgi:hypothetical protein